MITRSTTSAFNARTALVGTAVVLLFVSMMRSSWTGWSLSLRDQTQFLIAPVQAPVEYLVSWLRGPAAGARPGDPELARLREESETYRVLYYRALDEKQRLERAIIDLQHGIDLNPAMPVRQLSAAVIGRYSDLSTELLKVRGGAANGVTISSVAAFEGVNLVGRVVDVAERVTSVLPITDRHAGDLRARVYPGESLVPGAPEPGMTWLECRLSPTGKGRLRGPAEAPAVKPGEQAPHVKPGMTVRLADASWPRSAQMLVVGIVERVDVAANGRDIVTVKPMFDLQRLPEVALRISGEDDVPDETDPARGRTRPPTKGGRP